MFSKLNSFDDFLFENLDTTYFVISDDLFDVLVDINHPISTKLKSNDTDPPQKKITFIDINYNEYDKWMFVNSVKVNQYIEDKGGNINSITSFNRYKNKIIDKYSSKAKIGRLINKIYTDTYSTIQIEEFVQLYKKHFSTTFELLDIVKGKDILKWYDCKNYNNPDSVTELTQSCMADSVVNHFMDFYAVNDDKVQMLILYSDENKNKIDARAILWKPDLINGKKNTSGKLFLDRIYFNKQDHKNIMQKYADIKKWYYKRSGIYNPTTKKSEDVKFELNNMKISPSHTMPYADTLDVFDPKTNTITNDYEKHPDSGCLGSTCGQLDNLTWIPRYQKFYHINNLIKAYGENGQEYITREDAIYLPRYNKNYTKEFIDKHELVKIQDPIEVEDGDEENAPYYDVFKEDTIWSDEYNNRYYIKDVKYSDFLDIYIPISKAVLSKYMGTYLPREDTVKVVTDILGNGFGGYDYTYDFYLLSDPSKPFFKDKDGKYYLKSLKQKLKNIKKELKNEDN